MEDNNIFDFGALFLNPQNQPEKDKDPGKKKMIIKKKKTAPEPPKEEITVDMGKMTSALKNHLFILILKSMGLEDGEGLDFIRILLKHGCPVEALIKAFAEMNDMLNDEEDEE